MHIPLIMNGATEIMTKAGAECSIVQLFSARRG